MKNSVKVATTKNVAKVETASVNAIEQLKEKAEKAKVVKAAKPEKVISYKTRLESHAKFNAARNEECKKLGFALGLIEKHIDCFPIEFQNYVETMRNEQIIYKAAEMNCKRSKSGNFTPWLVEGYICSQVNKAAEIAK